jgi:hypothetical protein
VLKATFWLGDGILHNDGATGSRDGADEAIRASTPLSKPTVRLQL